ncbi:MAG TPA: SDR family oxidoreductase [Candidatus Binataceae bacterium]|nr:SDR family oxidoreductase [Candidatus Binataceae bacterium]
MRVFVTGATGFIGSAIVRELLASGHEVLGLARSDAAADTLARMGVKAHQGELSDTDSLVGGARACEGVIHTAFIHDFSAYEAAAETDRRAVEAMAGALEGSGKPFVLTSGSALLAPGRIGTEEDAPAAGTAAYPRAASEATVLASAGRGVRGSVVRLPPSVHGDGDHGFAAGFASVLIGVAREKRVSAYVGDGLNRWPAVHRLDAAHLYRLALEKGSAGARYHAVADEGVAVRDIAEVIGLRLNVPVVAKSREEAADHFGWLARFMGMDCPASSAQTRERLGWRPVHPGLIRDLERVRSFET